MKSLILPWFLFSSMAFASDLSLEGKRTAYSNLSDIYERLETHAPYDQKLLTLKDCFYLGARATELDDAQVPGYDAHFGMLWDSVSVLCGNDDGRTTYQNLSPATVLHRVAQLRNRLRSEIQGQ